LFPCIKNWGQVSTGQSKPENSESEALTRLANSTIEKFRKVAAGFKLDASADAIMSSLIEAQAQFDEFATYSGVYSVSHVLLYAVGLKQMVE
jgi:hypothetical protein